MKSRNDPDYDVMIAIDRRIRYPESNSSKDTIWIKVGAAWRNEENDNIRMIIDTLPINYLQWDGKFILMPFDRHNKQEEAPVGNRSYRGGEPRIDPSRSREPEVKKSGRKFHKDEDDDVPF